MPLFRWQDFLAPAPPLTVAQAASLLSKQAKKAERSRRIEKMNELRAGLNWEPFVPGGRRG